MLCALRRLIIFNLLLLLNHILLILLVDFYNKLIRSSFWVGMKNCDFSDKILKLQLLLTFYINHSEKNWFTIWRKKLYCRNKFVFIRNEIVIQDKTLLAQIKNYNVYIQPINKFDNLLRSPCILLSSGLTLICEEELNFVLTVLWMLVQVRWVE